MSRAIIPPGFPPNPFLSPGTLVESPSRTLYVSGQVGVGPGGKPAEGIGAQASAAIGNLNAVLAAAGMSTAGISSCAAAALVSRKRLSRNSLALSRIG